MNSILANAPLGARSPAFFTLQRHPVHPRLRHVALDPAAVQTFLRGPTRLPEHFFYRVLCDIGADGCGCFKLYNSNMP